MIKEFWPGASWKWPVAHLDRVMLSDNFIRHLKHPWEMKIPFMLDSGAFSVIAKYGKYPDTNLDYANRIKSWHPDHSWTRDYPCEPELREKWGYTPREAQLWTNDNTIELNDKYGARVYSVIQGYELSDYLENLDLVKERGLITKRIGIGTLCRRNQDDKIYEIVEALYRELPASVKIHLFGVKITLLKEYPSIHAYSSDSQAMYWDWQQKGKKHREAGTYYGINGKLEDLRKYLSRVENMMNLDQKVLVDYMEVA